MMLPNETSSHIHSSKSVGLSVVSVVYIFTTLTGNSFVFLAMYRYKKLRTKSNLIIMNVCIADVLFAILWLPINAFYWMQDEFPSSSLCQYLGVIGLLCSVVSIYTLTFVSIERFLATNFPLQHRRFFTMTAVKCGLAFIWMSGIFMSLLPFGVAKYSYLERFVHCVKDWSNNRTSSFIYFTFSYTIPLFTILFCNMFILRSIRRGVKSIDRNKTANSIKRRQERWACFVVVTIILAFIVCWTPYAIAGLCFQIEKCNPPKEFMSTAVMLAGANGSCNPVIYGIMNKNFRTAFINILYCRQPRVGNNSP